MNNKDQQTLVVLLMSTTSKATQQDSSSDVFEVPGFNLRNYMTQVSPHEYPEHVKLYGAFNRLIIDGGQKHGVAEEELTIITDSIKRVKKDSSQSVQGLVTSLCKKLNNENENIEANLIAKTMLRIEEAENATTLKAVTTLLKSSSMQTQFAIEELAEEFASTSKYLKIDFTSMAKDFPELLKSVVKTRCAEKSTPLPPSSAQQGPNELDIQNTQEKQKNGKILKVVKGK